MVIILDQLSFDSSNFEYFETYSQLCVGTSVWVVCFFVGHGYTRWSNVQSIKRDLELTFKRDHSFEF